MTTDEQFENVKDWLPTNPALSDYDYVEKRFKKKRILNDDCAFLWTRMTINWNGDVFPCCNVFGDNWAFGNVLKTSVKEVWNNPRYVGARKAVQGQTAEQTICNICKKNEAMR